MNTADPVEFVVAAFGLKAAAIAGRRGAGVISFGLLAPEAWSAFDATRRQAAREAGRPQEVDSYVMTSLHVRGGNEDRYSDLAKDKMGHIAMALLTFAARQGLCGQLRFRPHGRSRAPAGRPAPHLTSTRGRGRPHARPA